MNFVQIVHRTVFLIIIFTLSLTVFSCFSPLPPPQTTLLHKESQFKYNLSDKTFLFSMKTAPVRSRGLITLQLLRLQVEYKKGKPTHIIIKQNERWYNSYSKITRASKSISIYKIEKTSETELETTLISREAKISGNYNGPNVSEVEKWDENPSNYTFEGEYKLTKFGKEKAQDLFTVMEKGKVIKSGLFRMTYRLQE